MLFFIVCYCYCSCLCSFCFVLPIVLVAVARITFVLFWLLCFCFCLFVFWLCFVWLKFPPKAIFPAISEGLPLSLSPKTRFFKILFFDLSYLSLFSSSCYVGSSSSFFIFFLLCYSCYVSSSSLLLPNFFLHCLSYPCSCQSLWNNYYFLVLFHCLFFWLFLFDVCFVSCWFCVFL